MTTIYSARKIITMNPRRPVATHVAVRDGRIVGAGVWRNWQAGASTRWTTALPTRC